MSLSFDGIGQVFAVTFTGLGVRRNLSLTGVAEVTVISPVSGNPLGPWLWWTYTV